MSADKVLSAIKEALGNPSSGPFVDYWDAIEAAVRAEMEPAKTTRVVETPETR